MACYVLKRLTSSTALNHVAKLMHCVGFEFLFGV
jgi:hypothetical protein